MEDCIDALHQAYLDLASGTAVTRQRTDSLVSSGDFIYGLKTMDGIDSRLGMGAVRINSDILTWPKIGSTHRRVKVPAAIGNRYTGLILLFSIKTGEPLAVMPDGVIQRMRVGATSAIGTSYLARTDARMAAVVGTGWQAGAQLMGLAIVRPDIEIIRVFSPNVDNVRKFCKEWGRRMRQTFVPTESLAEAIQKCAVVLCATSSIDPIFQLDHFEYGMHVGSIKPPEISPACLEAADIVAVHFLHRKPGLIKATGLVIPDHSDTRGWETSDKYDFSASPTLPELISGTVGGRSGNTQRTCFVNDLGLGLQFATVAGLAYEYARAVGLGTEMPTELFTQSEHP